MKTKLILALIFSITVTQAYADMSSVECLEVKQMIQNRTTNPAVVSMGTIPGSMFANPYLESKRSDDHELAELHQRIAELETRIRRQDEEMQEAEYRKRNDDEVKKLNEIFKEENCQKYFGRLNKLLIEKQFYMPIESFRK